MSISSAPSKNYLSNIYSTLFIGLGYFFLFAHNLLVSYSTASVSLPGQMIMLVAALLFFASHLFCYGYLSAELLLTTLSMVAAAVLVFWFTGKLDLIYLVFLLFIANYIPADDFIRADIFCRIILVLLIVVLSQTGIIRNKSLVTDTFIGQHTVRHGLGFRNPNTFGNMLLIIFVELCILLQERELWRHLLCPLSAILLITIIAMTSVTRTAILLILLALILNYIQLPKESTLYRIAKYAIPLLCLLCILLAQLYRSGLGAAINLNSLVSGRLGFISSFMRRYSIRLFGNKVSYISGSYASQYATRAVICDNFYIYELFNMGAIAFALWCWVGYSAISNLWKNNRLLELNYFLLFLLYGLMENTITNVIFFPLVVYAAGYLNKGSVVHANQKRTERTPSLPISISVSASGELQSEEVSHE